MDSGWGPLGGLDGWPESSQQHKLRAFETFNVNTMMMVVSNNSPHKETSFFMYVVSGKGGLFLGVFVVHELVMDLIASLLALILYTPC